MSTGAEFESLLARIRALSFRPGLTVDEVPAPQRLATHAFAMSGEVVLNDAELASGRIVILHEPAGVESWDGRYRVVGFGKATLEPELAADPMLPDVAWTWLEECLEGLDFHNLGGTVTRASGHGYGDLVDQPVTGQVEVRASWTPADDLVDLHVVAWADLLAQLAGLPPLPRSSGTPIIFAASR